MQDNFLRKDCNFVNIVKQEQLLGSFKLSRQWRQRERQNSHSFRLKKNSALAEHLSLLSLQDFASFHALSITWTNDYEFLFLNFDIFLKNSTQEELAYIR